ncbi:hypothetical protein H6P81_005598 [Aristolochia fimbriata]|uniref:Uncharacterized protein n=1 Tax=Aristolochia fimbriata TaxID=158543 RepID=A0AAV7EWB9_ARIFI|nr:hypothetical protein H6P81_005598 [Aristolochia fimbriata]
MPFLRGASESNLECFLNCTTPSVPSQFLPETGLRSLNRLWHPWERESVEYFKLDDLWACYDEWSAYGAGVPILLKGEEETVVQYYVPYLSAIQIFTSSGTLSNSRNLKEESEAEGDSYSCSDIWSDESETTDDQKQYWKWGHASPDDDQICSSTMVTEQESLWRHLNDRLGFLYFQYFERSAPYCRVPLSDKIQGLSKMFPGLKTLKSVELSPASWMAVAWYPIYHIPTGRSVKDLSACFLTYHTLSSSYQDGDETKGSDHGGEDGKGHDNGGRRYYHGRTALPPFGVATYKLHGSLWIPGEKGRDQERLVALLSAADSWLKQLRVQHHDFNYFAGIRLGN